MNKLFLHHRYIDLPPRDLSDNGNDGIGYYLIPGDRSLSGAVGFNGSTSWIKVPRPQNTDNQSMDNLGQFKGRVVFRVDPAAPAHRLNLVEGYLSFAIYINPDRSVSFTIVDRDRKWNGCSSSPGLVSTGVWHTLVAAHDGISEARIGLDAEVVASHKDVLGPVPSVGDLGIAIGRWPDEPRYQFQGYLSEVALSKFDPVPEINLVLGAPCIDAEALAALLQRISNRVGEERLATWAHELQGVLHQVAQVVQINEPSIMWTRIPVS